MSSREMMMIFCYDVSDNKSRRKVAKLLEAEMTRVQYSVFECRMTRVQSDILAQRAASHLGEGDSLRVYAVGQNGYRRSRVYGDASPFEPVEGYWLI